jgi:hypothetical protein
MQIWLFGNRYHLQEKAFGVLRLPVLRFIQVAAVSIPEDSIKLCGQQPKLQVPSSLIPG